MRVLLVEDDELLRSLTSRILRGLGHDVAEAAGARPALDQLRGGPEPIDILFTDIRLGGSSDGIELARLALEIAPALRILLTSGDPSSFQNTVLPEDRVRLLPKPYRKDDIRRVLEDLAGTGTGGSP